MENQRPLAIGENPKLGVYTVGSNTFHGKPQALIEATKTNQFPTWDFNNIVFDKLDYTVEPEVPLLTLYKIRAQQLRDKYDYIRLEFSGGSDSATALYAFINNDIHIDEVVIRYPKTGEKDVEADPFNYKAENTLSEFKYAAVPILEWLKLSAPRTKITIHDYSIDMLTSTYDEGWVFNTKDYFQPGHSFKHNPIGMKEHKILADSGKSICILYGLDKPKVCIQDKKWYMYFIDVIANHSVSTFGDYTNMTNEYFFWTPDLPELVLKQAHVVMNWFNLPGNHHAQYLCRWPNYSYTQRSAYEHLIKPLIYPEYDPTTFQTNKPSNSFYNEMDQWFYKNLDGTEQYQIWKAGLRFLVDKIDPKYFNYEGKEPVGFVGFLSPFHYLGDANFVDSGINLHHRF
jgi:hypothetical protein